MKSACSDLKSFRGRSIHFTEKSKKTTTISIPYQYNKEIYPNLKEVDLRQVSNLFGCSFPNCTGLKTIYLPSPRNNLSVGYYFPGCTNLTDVYYDDTESSWAMIVGPDTPNNNNFSESEELIYKAKKHFKAKKSSYGGYDTAPYSVWSHDDCRAEQRSNPAKKCTFSLPADQKTVKIPDTVVLYKDGSHVKVTEIDGGWFEYNENNTLTNLTIGKNVTVVSNGGSRGCPKLKKITINSTKLYSHISIYEFEGIHPNAVIKVPKKQLAAYKKMLNSLKVKVIA